MPHSIAIGCQTHQISILAKMVQLPLPSIISLDFFATWSIIPHVFILLNYVLTLYPPIRHLPIYKETSIKVFRNTSNTFLPESILCYNICHCLIAIIKILKTNVCISMKGRHKSESWLLVSYLGTYYFESLYNCGSLIWFTIP